ncbi:hypothetical protein ES703_118881 [subsurface metagenome]
MANASGDWIIETVGDGFRPSITVDSLGDVHISYARYDGSDLILTYQNLSKGDFYEVNLSERGYDEYQSGSLSIDSIGTIHMSFMEAWGGASSGDLVYGNMTDGVFYFETLDTAYDRASMAVDPNNKVHISYYSIALGGLFYLTNVDGTWRPPELVDNVGGQLEGMCTSIAVDSQYVHISYVGGDKEDNRYAKRGINDQWGSPWEITHIADGDFQSAGNSIAVDSDGYVHISYYHKQSETLKGT